MTNSSSLKNKRSWHRFKLLIFISSFSILLAVSSPLLIRDLFFRMPKPSASFDCDDSTLVMVQRLNAIGIKATPILGNLKMNGEAYGETDHVWALVSVAGLRIPFDWGTPQFDKQHYEGYTLTNKQLLFFVNQDFISPAGQVPATTP